MLEGAKTHSTRPTGWKLFAGTLALCLAMHFVHELAHMAAAIGFGVGGTLGTNTVRFAAALSSTQTLWINLAGPAITLAIPAAAILAKWRWAASAAFIAFYQRALAAIITLIAAPNDEARIGDALGVGPWPVFAGTVGLGLAMLVWQARRDRCGMAWLGIVYVASSVGVAIMVFADAAVPRIVF